MKQVEAISRHNWLAPNVRGGLALHLRLDGGRQATPTSDLDLFIDHDPAQKFSLIELIGIQQFLKQELRSRSISRHSLHPMLRADIEQSALGVF
ncbi:DNA polymerase III subunit beta [Rhizobium rhizophilum]|uniref:DNA polymerase III subunit beta n=1 Tax=Rhizobium rhizophilum TaxID=1850373 RepID=UPI001F45CC3F|nr:DNA polymerase III subunit beta [Rhizobium rhizophilum]